MNRSRNFPCDFQMSGATSMAHSELLHEDAEELLRIANAMRNWNTRNGQKGLKPMLATFFASRVNKVADSMFKQHLKFEIARLQYLEKTMSPE